MEKFALLDLLHALNGINNTIPTPSPSQTTPTSVPPPPSDKPYNAMEGVLSRHEQIANRLRQKK